jgi:hypothetical protein
MNNMVINEVYRTPTTTSLTISLFASKSFIFCHLFNEDGRDHVEFLKGEKLNQILLKFTPLCSFGICNLIASLKHHPNNPGSFDCILKLKALFGYDYIHDNCFLGQ